MLVLASVLSGRLLVMDFWVARVCVPLLRCLFVFRWAVVGLWATRSFCCVLLTVPGFFLLFFVIMYWLILFFCYVGCFGVVCVILFLCFSLWLWRSLSLVLTSFFSLGFLACTYGCYHGFSSSSFCLVPTVRLRVFVFWLRW